MIADREAYAKALAAAFVADMARSGALQDEIVRGRVGARGLRNMILRDLRRGVAGAEGSALFPNLRAFVAETIDLEALARRQATLGELGEWAELASVLVGAASSYINKRVESKTVSALSKIDVQKQQLAAKAAELEASRARMQYAASEQTARAAEAGAGPLAAVGIPGWVVPAGIAAAVAIGGYFLLKGRR